MSTIASNARCKKGIVKHYFIENGKHSSKILLLSHTVKLFCLFMDDREINYY